MLEQLRQQSKSFIIWILFGIIILVFIISFGPQAQGNIGCGSSDSWVMKVNGREVSEDSWRYAVNGVKVLPPELLQGMNREQRTNFALDQLLLRELLAQAAEDEGFVVSTDLANEKITQGEWLFLGFPASRGWYFKDGFFDYDHLDNHAAQLGGLSVSKFIDQQRREVLAQAMEGTILASVYVSHEELLEDFKHNNTTATVEFVKFRPAAYEVELRKMLSDDQVSTYLAAHEADIKKKYDDEKGTTHSGVKPQAHIRKIFIKKTAEAEPEPEGDGDQKDKKDKKDKKSKKDKKPVDPKKLAETIHKKLTEGADFAALAAKHSDDADTKNIGGDLGWKTIAHAGLGDEKLSDALQALEPGKFSDVIETDAGYTILAVEGKREGDLTYDQVKHEIARDEAIAFYAREGARRDAEAALAEAMSGKALEDLFERQAVPTPPPMDIEKQIEQMDLSPQEKKDLLEKLRNMQKQQPKSGSLVFETDAVPAKWQGGDKPAAGAPAAGNPKAGAAPAKAATKPAKKPAKKAAEKPAAAGAGEIPHPDTIPKPKLEPAGPFTREATRVRGVGESAAAANAIFDELTVGQLADQLFEVGGDYVILRVTDKEDPDLKEFNETEPVLRQRALLLKGYFAVQTWLLERCQNADKSGDVVVDTGNGRLDIPKSYKACETVPRWGLARLRTASRGVY